MMRTWEELRGELVRPEDEGPIRDYADHIRAEVRAHRLAETRERLRVTQRQLADQLGISQASISKIERGDIEHAKIETIAKYIQGLGGTLDVTARFGNTSYRIA